MHGIKTAYRSKRSAVVLRDRGSGPPNRQPSVVRIADVYTMVVNNNMWRPRHRHVIIHQTGRFGEMFLWCVLIVQAMTVRADTSGCADRFEVHRDKIIRTEDSKKLGAKFIDSVGQRNRFECLELCCQTTRCDVFVFEEKVIARGV